MQKYVILCTSIYIFEHVAHYNSVKYALAVADDLIKTSYLPFSSSMCRTDIYVINVVKALNVVSEKCGHVALFAAY